jgi:SpoVK/Ycf46/Vps4 family AAA+-type ATPase
MHVDDLNNVVADTLKHSFLANVRTGNVIVDTFVGFIVMTFITTFVSKFVMAVSTGRNWAIWRYWDGTHDIRNVFRRKNVIKITGRKFTDMLFLKTRIDFSMRFQAVVGLINDLTHQNALERNIRQLSEFQIRERIKYNADLDVDETEKDFSFIVDQKQVIYLKPDVYCKITCDSEVEDAGSNNNKRTIARDTYDISIYSYKYSCKELFDYLDQITDDYERKQKEINNKHKYILSYDGIGDADEGGGVKWTKERFRSNKRFDNMFFEGKDDVLRQVSDFIDGREMYRKIGKPYHLGIVLYGEPGCGKTSFINALANELGRSVKEINFSKLKTVEDLERSITCTEYNSINMDYDNVIITFEDIDCATNIVKSRKLMDEENCKKNSDSSNEEDADEGHEKDIKNMVKALTKLSGKKDREKMSGANWMDFEKIDKKDSQITLSNLLNIIDGSREMPGRIIVITTNRIDWIDEALLREGRIDIRVEMKKIGHELMWKMYENFREAQGVPIGIKERVDWEETRGDFVHQPPCKVINKIQKHKNDFAAMLESFKQN